MLGMLLAALVASPDGEMPVSVEDAAVAMCAHQDHAPACMTCARSYAPAALGCYAACRKEPERRAALGCEAACMWRYADRVEGCTAGRYAKQP